MLSALKKNATNKKAKQVSWQKKNIFSVLENEKQLFSIQKQHIKL